MKRIVSVYLPHWPIERMRAGFIPGERLGEREPCRTRDRGNRGKESRNWPPPFALVEATSRGVRLAAVNESAEAAGIYAGEALADARARVPDLAIAQGEPAADRSGLRKLALWLGRYGIARNAYGLMTEAPSGYMIRCYGLWVDIAGVAHLFGGEAALLADVEMRLSRFKLTARLGLADTFGAAHALAWYGGGEHDGQEVGGGAGVAAPGASLDSITHLPVAGLRLDQARISLLHRLGFKTIGSLAHVSRVALQRRFGGVDDQERVVLRLDQALGVREEPRRPLVEVPAFSERASFAEPLISAEGLKSEVEVLVDALCRRLEAARSGARAVRLSFYRSDGSSGAVSIRVARPVRVRVHLMDLLGPKLDTIDLGFGADALVLDAVRIEAFTVEQTALTTGSDGTSAAVRARLIDRLVNRLGGDNVSHIVLQPSHWPERTVVHASVLGPACSGSALQEKSPPPVRCMSRTVMSSRPAVLLPSPEPIAVVMLLPEGAPVRFVWRRARHKIVRAQGPERIEPEWWLHFGRSTPAVGRDYYALEDDAGGRFWVFRARRTAGEDVCLVTSAGTGTAYGAPEVPAWYIHGLYC